MRPFLFPAIGVSAVDGSVAAVSVERRAFRVVVTRARRVVWARPEHGASRPRVGLEPRARDALRALLAEIGRPVLERVCVTYPGLGTTARFVEVPAMGARREHEMARYELLRSLRGPVDDYEVVLERARGRGGETVGITAVAVPRRHLRAFLADLEEVGLEHDALLPAPAALAAFARYDRPHAGDRVLVQVGRCATDVVFEHGGGLVYRTLPLGTVGLAGREEDRAEAARRLCERIAEEVGRGARFHFPRGFSPDQVLLFGEGAFDEDVVAHLDRLYPGRLLRCDRFHRLLVDPRAAGDEGGEAGERDPAAVGAALVAARIVPPPLLLAPFDRARAALRRLPGLAAAALVLSLSALGATMREVGWARRVSEARVSPTLEELERRTAREDALLARARTLAERRRRWAARLLSRRTEAGLAARIAACFGPENDSFGPADLRLRRVEARLAAEGPTTPPPVEVEGEAWIVEGGDRAATILRQRLLALPRVRSVAVETVTAPPSGAEPAPPEALRFRATFSARPEEER